MSRNAPITSDATTSPDTKTVSSTTGFSRGDLVYYKSGNNGPIPSNATTSATFNITTDAPINTGSLGGNIFTTPGYGASRNKSVATLTNGNIVRVFAGLNNYPSFTIISPTNAVVVATTVISSTYFNGYAGVGVVALSGGGFVAYWVPSSTGNAPTYAIYDNSGVVVTATQIDTVGGVTQDNTVFPSATALPNGSFVLSYITNTPVANTAKFRVYGATGTAISGWVVLGAATVGGAFFTIPMAARSDSTFVVFYPQVGFAYRYEIYSAVGVLITGANFFSTIGTGSTTQMISDVDVLADGTTFVLAYTSFDPSNKRYACFRFLPTGNVLGSEFYVPAENISYAAAGFFLSFIVVKKLTAGGFILVFSNQELSINYVIYNSAGVALSGSNSAGALPRKIESSMIPTQVLVSVLEVTGYINLYWASMYYANEFSPTQYLAQISKTTYNLLASPYQTTILGSGSAAVNGYSATNSSPSGAAFLAANSESISLNTTMGYTLSPTTITSAACDSIGSATLIDGRFVLGYRNSGTYINYVNIYSSSGGLEQTITVGTGYASAAFYWLKITPLSSGKFVVIWISAANTVTATVYSSGGTLVTQTVLPYNVSVANAAQSYGVAPLSNDRYVFAYWNANNGQATYTVLNSTNAQLATASVVYSTHNQEISVSSAPGDSFVVRGFNGSNQSLSFYTNTTGNTFVATGSTALGSSGSFNGSGVVFTPAGITAFMGGGSGAIPILFAHVQTGPVIPNPLSITLTSTASEYAQIGQTGNGTVLFWNTNPGTPSTRNIWSFPAGLMGQLSIGSINPANVFNAPISAYSSTGGSKPCITPGVGYNAVLMWLDASRAPTFAILNAYPVSAGVSITAGVTPSAPQAINPSTAGVLNGYVLQGVALTDASIGGTGQVQTRGAAQLNSNYSATAPYSAFDFQSPNGAGISGVKGSVLGRNVLLEGDS